MKPTYDVHVEHYDAHHEHMVIAEFELLGDFEDAMVDAAYEVTRRSGGLDFRAVRSDTGWVWTGFLDHDSCDIAPMLWLARHRDNETIFDRDEVHPRSVCTHVTNVDPAVVATLRAAADVG